MLFLALIVAACGTNSTAPPEAAADASAEGETDASAESEPPDHLVGAVGNWDTDWSQVTIDTDELALGLSGSDPRDGIPPIDDPEFESLEDAEQWLEPDDPGTAVEIDGEARFYPLAILTSHEIVNDNFGDVPVAVTYCPLCNSAVTFDRRVDGVTLRFGVSGLLRQSDLVMWDDATDSLWQQITGEGIVGEYAGTELDVLLSSIVSFEQFSQRYPEGFSLDPDSGRGDGAYGANPYVGYSSQSGPITDFYTGEVDDRLGALERVVGVTVGEADRAYPFADLTEKRVLNDTLGGEEIVVLWGGTTADALDSSSISDGKAIGTAAAYKASIDEHPAEPLTFVSDGDEIVDEQTGSTWSVLGQATAGPLEGTTLELVAHRNEFWFAWSGFFPDGELHTS